tara:strand:+ start:295 stop:480 length:186 start_codon:yes stop_codon:yes gene_type:complete
MAFPTSPIYKLIKDPIRGVVNQVKKQNDNIITIIPFDEANTDYQEYLEWKAIDGNEPEAAD